MKSQDKLAWTLAVIITVFLALMVIGSSQG